MGEVIVGQAVMLTRPHMSRPRPRPRPRQQPPRPATY